MSSVISNKTILLRYLSLTQTAQQTQVLYVWIDGTGEYMRAKSRTVNFVPKIVKELPIWTYCGAATFQAEGYKAEFYLIPVALYNDPFRGGNNKIVLCETIKGDHQPTESNKRASCNDVMEKVKNQEPWFKMKQSYTLLDACDNSLQMTPLGWPRGGFPAPDGPYYCGVGSNRVYGRDVVEAHYRACLYAGVKISGENAKVMPSQWEFQIGPCEGIKMGDDLWISRFLLYRTAEDFHIGVSFDPKSILGNCTGAGPDTNFSTKSMRENGNFDDFEKDIEINDIENSFVTIYDPYAVTEAIMRTQCLEKTL